MTEQHNGMIVVDGSGRELPILRAWINSSAVYYVKAGFRYQAMFFCVGSPDKTKWSGKVLGSYDVTTDMFEFYVPCEMFTESCETFYRVLALDDNGRRTVCGEGKLRVNTVRIKDFNDEIRKNLVYFEADSAWRNVVIEYDDSGAPTFAVENDPTEVPVGVYPKEVFAYDASKGKFFKVYGSIDETGTPIVNVSQTPEGDGFDSFIYNTGTGFYHRAEAFEDEYHVESLQVGEAVVG